MGSTWCDQLETLTNISDIPARGTAAFRAPRLAAAEHDCGIGRTESAPVRVFTKFSFIRERLTEREED
jgi:hypothetical protein